MIILTTTTLYTTIFFICTSMMNVWESNTDSETRKEYFKECVKDIKDYYPPPPMLHEEDHIPIPMPTMLHEEAEDYYEIREF